MIRITPARTLISAAALALALAGCSASGGQPQIPSGAVEAQETTCEKFLDMSPEGQEDLIGTLIEAEQRAVTPRLNAAYQGVVATKCFDSTADTPVGYVNEWRLPVSEKLDFPDYAPMSDDQAAAAFPDQAQWSQLGLVAEDNITTSPALSEPARQEDLQDFYGEYFDEEGLCRISPPARFLHRSPEVGEAIIFHNSIFAAGPFGTGRGSYGVEVVAFNDQGALDAFIRVAEGSGKRDEKCNGEDLWTVVPTDVSRIGVSDSFGTLSAWTDEDGNRRSQVMLMIEAGDGQVAFIWFPTPELITDPVNLSEDVELFTEDQAATARWLYRRIGGEQGLPTPGDVEGTSGQATSGQ